MTYKIVSQYRSQAQTLSDEQKQQIDAVCSNLLKYKGFQEIIQKAGLNPADITSLSAFRSADNQAHLTVCTQTHQYTLLANVDEKIQEAAEFLLNPKKAYPDFKPAPAPSPKKAEPDEAKTLKKQLTRLERQLQSLQGTVDSYGQYMSTLAAKQEFNELKTLFTTSYGRSDKNIVQLRGRLEELEKEIDRQFAQELTPEELDKDPNIELLKQRLDQIQLPPDPEEDEFDRVYQSAEARAERLQQLLTIARSGSRPLAEMLEILLDLEQAVTQPPLLQPPTEHP